MKNGYCNGVFYAHNPTKTYSMMIFQTRYNAFQDKITLIRIFDNYKISGNKMRIVIKMKLKIKVVGIRIAFLLFIDGNIFVL